MSDLICPLLECHEPLHIKWTMGRSLASDDLDDASPLPDSDEYHVQTWEVVCEAGHVVLLPGPAGCCSEDLCGHDETECDWSDDTRTFRKVDRERLLRLLSADES